MISLDKAHAFVYGMIEEAETASKGRCVVIAPGRGAV
jgi:hypothetical protein